MKNNEIGWIEKLPQGWKIKRLKTIAHILNGGTPKPNFIFSEKTDELVYWATPADFKDITPSLSKTTRTIHKSKIFEAGNLLMKGDLLISCRAPVGKVAYITEPMSFNQGCKAVVLSNKHCSKYFFYSLIASKKYLQQLSNGTTFDELSTATFKNVFMPMPCYTSQTAIANYLDHETARIDAEIKKEERRIELLEELLQATIFETVTKGLDKNAEMVDSGIDWIGEIPKGWEVTRLKNISNIQKGSEFNNEWAEDSGNFPYINGGMTPSYFSNKFNTPANFIAVSEGGASAGFVQFVTTKFWAGQHCYKVKPACGVLNEYLFYVLKGFEHLFMREKTGSAMPNLQKTRFLNQFVVYSPDVVVQESVKDYLKRESEKIITMRQAVIKKIELLKELKQATIYEAVTGKTEIPSHFYSKE